TPPRGPQCSERQGRDPPRTRQESRMSRVDWVVLAFAGLGALTGLRRGLVATALSFGGLIAGAVVGARVAPHLLHGGSGSPYTPLAGVAGAVVGPRVVPRPVRGGRGCRPPRRSGLAPALVGPALLAGGAGRRGACGRGALAVVPRFRRLVPAGGLVGGPAASPAVSSRR